MAAAIFDLTRRVALVTGSSRGIGLALARAWPRPARWWCSTPATPAQLGHAADELAAGATVHLAFDVTDRPRSTRRSPTSRRSGRSTSWSTMPASSTGRRSRNFRADDWEQLHGDQSRPRLPRRPGGGPAHDRARPRQDHQHRLGAKRARAADDRALHGDQGRREDADQAAWRPTGRGHGLQSTPSGPAISPPS